MDGSLSIELAGERVILLPQRALYWPDRKMVLVADLHLGKAATFRAAGIPAPEAVTQATLDRLSQVLAQTKAERLVVLGDLVHAKAGLTDAVCDKVSQWRDQHSDLETTLVTGNHDRRAGCLPADWRLIPAGSQMSVPPFTLLHHPEEAAEGYSLAGHVHPGILLTGAGRQRLKLPCFWLGQAVGVLPAFGDFTGLALSEPAANDRIFAVTPDSVLPITPSKPSRAGGVQ